MARTVIGDEDPDVHASQLGWTYVLTPFGTGDRVRVVFIGRYDPFCTSFKRRYHFSSISYLDEFEGLSLLIILQVVRMITTSKDGFLRQVRRWDLNSLKDCLPTWILSEAQKIDSAFCFVWVAAAAVDPLRNEVVLEKSDWAYYVRCSDFES